MKPEKGKKEIAVAVTALNAIDSPGPGIAVIRAIRENTDFEVRIIGLSYEALEPGIYMHSLVSKTYQLPYPSAGTEALYERLNQIHDIEKIDVIIPNFDAEMYNFIRIEPRLRKLGIRTFLPTSGEFEARDKVNLYKFGEKHNFYVPEDKVIFHSSELEKAVSDFSFPVVVKGKYYDAFICNTFAEAEKAFYKLQAKWGVPIIVQKFIPGTEINVAVLGDGRGNAVSIIPMRKLYITDKGKAWAGITIDDSNLIETAEKFVRSTRWKGGCELEIMMTSDGKPYIMEVNPRFPAWIYLSAAAGQNQPAMLVRMAMGEEVKPVREYTYGKMFIRYSWDMIVDIAEFQKISGTGEL
jgi:carbamoyl-phosphate synthase large subunit